MGDERRALLEDTLTAAVALHERAKQHPQPVLDAAAAIIGALKARGKLMVFGNGGIFFVLQIATAMILTLAANTAYADFPRLSSIIARDGYLPRFVHPVTCPSP